jgi:BCD family chlorophyll transporter-like MFS transporter
MKTMFRILNNVRLALFPIAYALSGVLIGSTLNRVMIADLGYSATLTALFFAIPLTISPIRVWIGYHSDGALIFGRRREPYIILGALVIGLGILAISNLIARLQNGAAAVIGLAFAFLLYGIGRNIGHNTFQALVADRYEGAARSRAATFYEVATMFGMVMGAGAIKSMLKIYDPFKLINVALVIAGLVLALAVFAAWGQEDKTGKAAAEKAREVKFSAAFKQLVWADPQVRLFFIIVMLTFIGTLAQDVLLEPYGALVLRMQVGETTGLTQYWGIGVLLAMLACGFFLLKWLGWIKTMRAGMALSILAFLGPIAAGLAGSVPLLKGAVFVMGLGTGLAGAGMLSGTLNFTSRLRAGMLLGVWAVANMAGHAFGSLTGGMIVDGVRAVTGSAFAAYAAVFGLEAALLAAAFGLTLKVDVSETQAIAEEHKALMEMETAATD